MITKYFLELDNSEPLYKEGNYTSMNSGSTESEVGEFLYGMVKILKPTKILETGTYHGWSSAYMAQGLKENGLGHLDTVEFEAQHIATSKERWKKLGVLEYITVINQDLRQFSLHGQFDLMFLDSEPQMRFGELVRFFSNLNPGGYVFLHDLPRTMCQGRVNPDHPEFESWPWGNLPDEIRQWVKEGILRPMYFSNPRGMVGFYKRHQEDYL